MTNRLHQLDGLRAVASVLVMAHHLGAAKIGSLLEDAGHTFLGNLVAGFTASGVELFFVLSAIVLAKPYVQGDRPMNLVTYVSRRVSRLMPPYLAAWVLAGFTVLMATRFPTWWTTESAVPVFSAQEWMRQVAILYVGRESYNFAWWSLSVEIAFYAILPVLVLVFTRLRGLGLWAAFGASVALAVFGVPLMSVSLLAQLAAYASCFCAGLIIARGGLHPMAWLPMLVLGIAWTLAANRYEQMNQHVGWGMLYFGVVLYAIQNPASRISKRLSSYLFLWLGERSYSLFLTHYSVIGLVCHATSVFVASKSGTFFLVTRGLSIPLSLVVMVLVFHFVERHFARGLITGGDVLPTPTVKAAGSFA